LLGSTTRGAAAKTARHILRVKAGGIEELVDKLVNLAELVDSPWEKGVMRILGEVTGGIRHCLEAPFSIGPVSDFHLTFLRAQSTSP
jgi:hypothetical protein